MPDRSATLVVPTLDGGAGLERLLESVDRQREVPEVLIVDNGGTLDGEAVAKRHRGVRVITPGKNLGFGRAVNLAARQMSTETLLVTNDDCVLDPGYTEALSSAVGAGAAMAAGVLLDARDPRLVESAGAAVDRTLLPFDHLNGQCTSALDDQPSVPLGPTGGAAGYALSAFRKAGGFDEGLFAYQEDVDLALRLRIAGGVCVLCVAARATHRHSSTLGSGSKRKNYLMGFGRGYMLRKWSVLRGRSRIAAVAGRELAILGGQAVVDRNLAGARGRVAGYRAASPDREYPAAILDGVAMQGPMLAARLRRRARLRADPASDAGERPLEGDAPAR